MKKHLILILILCFYGGIGKIANAQCTPGINFQLIDDANIPSAYSGCTTLTSDANTKRGCAWATNGTLDFTTNFSYDFQINLGNKNGGGADGMCFVMQNDPAGLCACGSTGGQMGAGGISKSLIIEIDTYLNFEDRDDGMAGVSCNSSTNPAHLDMWTNGNVNPPGTAGASGCPPPDPGAVAGSRYITAAIPLMNGGSLYAIDNGSYHLFRVSWSATTKKITAIVMNLAATATYGTVLSPVVTPTAIFGTNNPYFGFTASTGGLSNQQSFCLPAQFAILPLELIAFSAHYNTKSTVDIKWTVANAGDVQEYVLENSSDGMLWKEQSVQNVKMPGSVEPQNYIVTDALPAKPVCYYRLKSIAYNGKLDYSSVLAVNSLADGYDGIVKSIYPIPAVDELHFICSNTISGSHAVEVMLYDVVGKLVLKNAYENPIANGSYSIALNTLPTGLYKVVFSQDHVQQVNKISVVK